MKKRKNKLLLIGWDAADWEIISPLIGKGLLPNLKKVIDDGVYGNMSTMNPPYSPMLWTSVATGKTPDKHGILGFVEVAPGNESIRPVTSASRKVRAIWNILHYKGFKSNLVGWWPSFPPDPINGIVVSDKFQKVNLDATKQRAVLKDAIHPKSLYDKIVKLKMFPQELTKEHILPFIPKAANIDQESDKRLNSLARIISESTSVHNAATFLIEESEWDFMAVYYGFIDHMCHSFMRYHPPKLDKISSSDYENYKDVIQGAYRFQDMMLGRILELIDEDTTLIIMSDHGFESGNKRILTMPKVAAAPALEHRQFGMFVAKGPNIKKNEKVFGLGLIDIAPTILTHFNLPVGNDMDGKVILDIFKEPNRPQYIDSWENISGDFGLPKDEHNTQWSDEETMNQLIELGYVDQPDKKIENSVLKTKCDLKHNLARVYLGKKDFHAAKPILLELINEKEPINTSLFYYDLLNVCIELNEYDEASKHLADFKEIKSEVRFNLYFIEAEIEKGKGNINEAINILQKALENGENAELLYRLGNLSYLKGEFLISKDYFERAIQREPSKAKYHKGLAETYYGLGNYEEAAEYAFTSIELIKYYPGAHYILAKALEKLGDLKNAKLAYENAERLIPKNHNQSRMAIENIEHQLKSQEKGIAEFKNWKNQITVVSGLPRSGTSLMMQMLHKGGLDILTDQKREADVSNPKGYFEYDPVMSIHKDNSWLTDAQNKVVKIVAPLLQFTSSEYRYKVIFMIRDLNEVIKSQQIMKGRDPETLPLSLIESYDRLLKKVEIWEGQEPGVEILYVAYREVVNNPIPAIQKIESFLGLTLDKDAMAACVDKKLYRNKVSK